MATAIRTIVVLIFAWLMVFVVGSQTQIRIHAQADTWLFLVLSGLATGASWLCYFKALQIGDINKVVPIDKSSTVLTILLAFLFLGEPIGLFQAIGRGADRRRHLPDDREETGRRIRASPGEKRWLLYAVGSAVFASLTSILGKVGIEGVESNLGTAIRTGVVLVMAWVMVLVTGKAADGAADTRTGAGLYLPVRHCHRRLLAVLLPGAFRTAPPAWWSPSTS